MRVGTVVRCPRSGFGGLLSSRQPAAASACWRMIRWLGLMCRISPPGLAQSYWNNQMLTAG